MSVRWIIITLLNNQDLEILNLLLISANNSLMPLELLITKILQLLYLYNHFISIILVLKSFTMKTFLLIQFVMEVEKIKMVLTNLPGEPTLMIIYICLMGNVLDVDLVKKEASSQSFDKLNLFYYVIMVYLLTKFFPKIFLINNNK